MALNCGGRPPDHPQSKAGLLNAKKSSDMHMEMALEGSRPTTSAAISGQSTGHQMTFGGISSSASHGTPQGSYIGNMPSYASGGPAGAAPGSYIVSDGYALGGPAASGKDFYYINVEYGTRREAAQLQLGRSDHYYRGDNLQQQLQDGAAAPPSCPYEQAPVPAPQPLQAAISSDHHQRLRSEPQARDQKNVPSTSAITNMQIHTAPGEELLHEHRRAHYKNMGNHEYNAGDRIAWKIAPTRKVVETRGQQDVHDEDEDEDQDELAEVRTMQEKQSMPYELQQVAAPMSGSGGLGSSHGELAGAASMSTSSGGGDSINISMMMVKKRRLTNDQVRSLEVSFERESKLEPERKNELAVELGLQPRQVAVWFQNRRARSKTKQLERDFDLLKLQYDAVRSEKDKLQAQVVRLRDLLDAHMANSKGDTPSASRGGKQGMDTDMSILHSSPQNEDVAQSTDGSIDIVAKQSTTSLQCVGDSDPTLAHVLETPKSSSKGPITLEVKPSLQVPHLNPHHQVYEERKQQHDISHTFSPPTKLSLCSPQQLFIHQMVSMRMEGDNFNPPYHEPAQNLYNQEHFNLPKLKENEEEEYRSDSMICFDSAWHQDS